MAYLPLANLMHHKLRSALSAVGIGIGICMLITLSGLARGSLFEVAERLESVDADLIVSPRGWGENTADKSGSALPDKYAQVMLQRHGDLVAKAVCVFVWPMKLAGQDHRAAGVDAADWPMLTGHPHPTPPGRLYDPEGRFARWLEGQLLAPADANDDEVFDIPAAELARPGRDGLELVIDSRLAGAGGFRVGQKVRSAGHDWTIVGIVPAGGMTRVFLPRRTAQYLFGCGDITKSTMIFVKLRPGVDLGPAVRKLRATVPHDIVPLTRYRGMLLEKFGILFTYVDMVNSIALGIAFLFIMITLYTMVLQRTREIAILKSCGASDAFILRQVLAESALLTGAGTAVGIALSFAAAAAIEAVRPLLTVSITWKWIAVAVAAAAAGAIVSGLYPAWRAVRVDVVEALTLE
ncbi:MAG TPA: ABC transporter permease [Phycisphaerae bacterium]|nr:ABC transporter permease [Phycisphaerae bacterium]